MQAKRENIAYSRQQKTQRSHPLGFSMPFVRGGLSLRLTAYFLRSNHLLTALAIMPATIEEKKERISFTAVYLLSTAV